MCEDTNARKQASTCMSNRCSSSDVRQLSLDTEGCNEDFPGESSRISSLAETCSFEFGRCLLPLARSASCFGRWMSLVSLIVHLLIHTHLLWQGLVQLHIRSRQVRLRRI